LANIELARLSKIAREEKTQNRTAPDESTELNFGPSSAALSVRALRRKNLNKTHLKAVSDAKYLTLLNTFGMLEDVINEAAVPTAGMKSSIQPPKSFNEKELYGR
jgi:hypothetical protein